MTEANGEVKQTTTISVEGMTGAACVQRLERAGNPEFVAAAMALNSVSVVTNSLRLHRAWKPALC